MLNMANKHIECKREEESHNDSSIDDDGDECNHDNNNGKDKSAMRANSDGTTGRMDQQQSFPSTGDLFHHTSSIMTWAPDFPSNRPPSTLAYPSQRCSGCAIPILGIRSPNDG